MHEIDSNDVSRGHNISNQSPCGQYKIDSGHCDAPNGTVPKLFCFKQLLGYHRQNITQSNTTPRMEQ